MWDSSNFDFIDLVCWFVWLTYCMVWDSEALFQTASPTPPPAGQMPPSTLPASQSSVFLPHSQPAQTHSQSTVAPVLLGEHQLSLSSLAIPSSISISASCFPGYNCCHIKWHSKSVKKGLGLTVQMKHTIIENRGVHDSFSPEKFYCLTPTITLCMLPQVKF
jgi:hypothetical protein